MAVFLTIFLSTGQHDVSIIQRIESHRTNLMIAVHITVSSLQIFGFLSNPTKKSNI